MVLARVRDYESAAGQRTVLARWRDDDSAAGRTGVLARLRNDELAAGQTMVLARGRDGGIDGRADDGSLACAMMSQQRGG